METPKICCPKCGSEQLSADKKGFSGGKAAAGVVLTGGIGLLAGTIGSKDIIITCLNCGNQWKAGDIKSSTDGLNKEEKVITLLKEGKKIEAYAYLRESAQMKLAESDRYIEDIIKKHGIVVPGSSQKIKRGKTNSIIFFIVFLALSLLMFAIPSYFMGVIFLIPAILFASVYIKLRNQDLNI